MLRFFDGSLPQQPTEYFDMGIFLAFFVVVSLVCLILLIKIKLKQRRSQVIAPALNLKELSTQQALAFIKRTCDGRCSDRSAAVDRFLLCVDTVGACVWHASA